MVFKTTFIRLVLIETIRQMFHYLDAHGNCQSGFADEKNFFVRKLVSVKTTKVTCLDRIFFMACRFSPQFDKTP